MFPGAADDNILDQLHDAARQCDGVLPNQVAKSAVADYLRRLLRAEKASYDMTSVSQRRLARPRLGTVLHAEHAFAERFLADKHEVTYATVREFLDSLQLG
ncbi:MAG: hypothetical protein MHM6MM_001673 [Cercozoa sp. M6MM]